MREELSRSEKLEMKCFEAAKSGKWGITYVLFDGEISRNMRKGLTIVTLKELANGRKSVSVSWPVNFELTLSQSCYISGYEDESPHTENLAQRLAIETLKSLAAKAK